MERHCGNLRITPSARAAILQQLSSTMISLYQSGLVSAEAALEELRSQGRLLGVFANLEAPTTHDTI